MVITLEEFSRRPERVLAEIFSWLGLEDAPSPSSQLVKENVTQGELTQIRTHALESFGTSRFWNALGPWVPGAVRRWGHRLNRRTVRPGDVDVEPVVSFLRPIQQEQTERLGRILGRDFSEWTTLCGCSEGPPAAPGSGADLQPLTSRQGVKAAR